MLLSVVIPTYRRAAMLAELLDALAPQLFPDAEVLVVDNDPEASARATVARYAGVRYIHEARRGVVNARNRGVAEAQAPHIVFIDDDEVPSPGWLAAFAGQARAGVVASFGRIVPRYEGTPPANLKPLLDALFSREADGPTGTDITPIWNYLGTGNAMFERRFCFPDPDPFDARFNSSGGEDIWMIRSLLQRGARLTWNREAMVEEQVPAARMTADYLERRKFGHGQQRVIFAYGEGGLRPGLSALAWMGVGAVQFVGHGLVASGLKLVGSPRAAAAAAKMQGGLGKLMWRSGRAGAHYG
jgi:glycosyltransferase involved in cell wall biosynthesis